MIKMLKKLISILLTFMVAMAFMAITVFAESEFAGGAGTSEDPYKVSTPEQLNAVRNYLDACFVQVCDIDMTEVTAEGGSFYNNGAGWTPIGTSTKNFTGTYDGNGFVINGLYCKVTAKGTPAGLFGYSSGTLKNIGMKRGNITSTTYCAGGVVGYAVRGGTISNCYNTGHVFAATRVGGIVGCGGAGVTISNCYNTGALSANSKSAGGIIGYSAGYSVSKVTISNCYNLSDIQSTYTPDSTAATANRGGIVGSMVYTTISQCFNRGDITSETRASIGGIAGSSDNYSTISKCFNEGQIIDADPSPNTMNCAGGIAGENAIVEDCYNKGTVITKHSYRGGILGSSGEITNCYNTDTIIRNTLAGKLLRKISNSYNIVADSKATQLTLEQMKTQESFDGFDFESVWGIHPKINEGFPYLRWAHEDITENMEYTVNSLLITDESGNVLDSIPGDRNVYIEADITKNTSENKKDYIVIASYDNNGNFVDFKYMKGMLTYNQNVVFGTLMKNNNVKQIKVFVWDGISQMTPLSNVCVFE